MEHRPILRYVAAVKFRVPDFDAEALVHEAMILLLTTRDAIVNVRAWLVAAVCNGGRHYWRCRSRFEPLPCDLEEILYSRELVSEMERLDSELIMRQALSRLRPEERRILYLHYFEQLTVTELARTLGTTPGYAGKLVWKALRRVRRLFVADEARHRAAAYPGASTIKIELRVEVVVGSLEEKSGHERSQNVEPAAETDVTVRSGTDETRARVPRFAKAHG